MNFTMWRDYIKQKIRDTKSYLWMETFNVYGKVLMMIDDLEGPNGVKEMDQPSDEELSRDIKRVLLILEEIKERTEPYLENIRAFYQKFKNAFLSVDNVLLYTMNLRTKHGDEAFRFQCKPDESGDVGRGLELIKLE